VSTNANSAPAASAAATSHGSVSLRSFAAKYSMAAAVSADREGAVALVMSRRYRRDAGADHPTSATVRRDAANPYARQQ
jgi:hypothetical protein